MIDNPDILTNCANVFGLVSTSIPRTKFVPSSGIPNDATCECNSSFVKPITSKQKDKFQPKQARIKLKLYVKRNA